HQKVDAIVTNELTKYDAMVIVGGSGAMVDLANNGRLHDLILGFVKLNKPIAAECYGVACLAFARDIREKRSLLAGRHVTGHPLDCLELRVRRSAGPGFGKRPAPLRLVICDTYALGAQHRLRPQPRSMTSTGRQAASGTRGKDRSWPRRLR